MPRRLVLAAVITTAVGLARPAAADGFYFLEGLGVSQYHGELARHLGDSGLHIRGALGWRVGHVAVETWAGGEIPIGVAAGDASNGDVAARTSTPPGSAFSADSAGTVGVDVKVIQPLSTHWSAYARGGLSYMMMGGDGESSPRYTGRGLGATAGIQVAGKVRALGFLAWPLFFVNAGPKVHSALWLETSYSFHRLHGPGPAIDAKITGWTLGFSVGKDF